MRAGQSGDSTFVSGTTISFGAPALSRFSTTWSFAITPGGDEWSPFDITSGVAPPPGAINVSIMPVFQWNPTDGATGYEFMLADSIDLDENGFFTQPIISKIGVEALRSPAWQCELKLNYGTAYYWRVRAISKTSQSQWSTGIFTTKLALSPFIPPVTPQPSPVPPQPGTPLYIWVMIGTLSALVIVVVLLLIARTKRLH